MPNTKRKRRSDIKFCGKPCNFFGDHLFKRFGCRVLKLPVNLNLSCPNRNGTLDTAGCIFCSPEGSAAASAVGESPAEQMRAAASGFKRVDPDTRFIVYFQAYTNTYADTEELRKAYSQALNLIEEPAGLMIGTRPDCLENQTLDMIAEYNKEDFELWLEIGMQTMHDRSLNFLNRRHSHADTVRAVREAAARGIKVCVHVILGIPGESWEQQMMTSRELSSLPVSGVKFHQLHVIKGTVLEKLYSQGNIKLPSMKEYSSLLTDFIERLRPEILIHRLSADRNEETLIAPLWGHHKGSIARAVENEFKRRGTWQGFLLESGPDVV